MAQARRRCRASAPSGPAPALQLHLTEARRPPERPGPAWANLPQERVDPGLETVGADPMRRGVVGDGLPVPQIPVTPTAFKFHRTRPSPGTRAAKARIPDIESRWAPCSGGTRLTNLYRNAGDRMRRKAAPAVLRESRGASRGENHPCIILRRSLVKKIQVAQPPKSSVKEGRRASLISVPTRRGCEFFDSGVFRHELNQRLTTLENV